MLPRRGSELLQSFEAIGVVRALPHLQNLILERNAFRVVSASHVSAASSLAKTFMCADIWGYKPKAMGPVIPFRRRSSLPIALGVIAAAVFALAATMAFLTWQTSPGHYAADVEITRATPKPTGPIEVIDGDTVRMNGTVYRLAGFDTPERGDKAQCDDERRRAEAATARLRTLLTSGNARLERVACACRPGQEGTQHCNFGRLCGSLTIGGRDVGQILVGEGLAHPYVFGATSCPKRRAWCE
jgi:endonuclease YncB( thermonuclease family)